MIQLQWELHKNGWHCLNNIHAAVKPNHIAVVIATPDDRWMIVIDGGNIIYTETITLDEAKTMAKNALLEHLTNLFGYLKDLK